MFFIRGLVKNSVSPYQSAHKHVHCTLLCALFFALSQSPNIVRNLNRTLIRITHLYCPISKAHKKLQIVHTIMCSFMRGKITSRTLHGITAFRYLGNKVGYINSIVLIQMLIKRVLAWKMYYVIVVLSLCNQNFSDINFS